MWQLCCELREACTWPRFLRGLKLLWWLSVQAVVHAALSLLPSMLLGVMVARWLVELGNYGLEAHPRIDDVQAIVGDMLNPAAFGGAFSPLPLIQFIPFGVVFSPSDSL